MMKTTKRPSKAQIARNYSEWQIAKAERLRILWLINDEIFHSGRPACQLDALRDLHKLILDSVE